MRILVVEDDAALGMFLQKGLQLEGHDVVLVKDGNAALGYVMAHAPELMVLDLGLPEKDGVQVLEEMQGYLVETSVLVLTGRIGVEDRVKCLNLGADDFLMKPFSFSELNARCRALLRRRSQFADPTIRCAGVELNRMDRRVTREGQTIDLTVKEFALLEYLMQARGRTCPRSELLRKVWQMSPDAGTNVVDVYINYLRKKLGAARREAVAKGCQYSDEPDRLIETVRGEGYCMAETGKKPALGYIPDLIRDSLLSSAELSQFALSRGTFGMGATANA